jgi:IclR family transcriptional regulator, acetate operon repressor
MPAASRENWGIAMSAAERPSRVLAHLRASVNTLAATGPLSAADLAKEIGVPRPSAYRLSAALVHAGLATAQDDGSVKLGTIWLDYGQSALQSAAPWFHRDDLLRDLRDSSRLTVYLSVPRPGRTVCIRRLHGHGVQVLVLKPGGALPLHLGGVGRITLAFGPDDAARYLAELSDESVSNEAMAADVALSRERGYCLSDEDVTIGVAAVAVPVWDAKGSFLAALSVAGLRGEIVDRIDSLVSQLRDVADSLAESARA